MDPGVTLDGAWLEEDGHAPGIERRDMHTQPEPEPAPPPGPQLLASGQAIEPWAPASRPPAPPRWATSSTSPRSSAPARSSWTPQRGPARTDLLPPPHFACRARGRDGRAGYRGVDSGRFQNDTIVVASMP